MFEIYTTVIATLTTTAAPAQMNLLGFVNMYGVVFMAAMYLGLSVMALGAWVTTRPRREDLGFVVMALGLIGLYSTLILAVLNHSVFKLV